MVSFTSLPLGMLNMENGFDSRYQDVTELCHFIGNFFRIIALES